MFTLSYRLVTTICLVLTIVSCTDTLVRTEQSQSHTNPLRLCVAKTTLSPFILPSQLDSLYNSLHRHTVKDSNLISIWKVQDSLSLSRASSVLEVSKDCPHVAIILTDTTDAVLTVLFNDHLLPGTYRWVGGSGVESKLDRPNQRFNIVTINGESVDRTGPRILLK